jgi:hypothetical protein
LKLLTEGVHSREALEVVKDHVKNVMGPAAIAYSNTVLKMSKLQAAQVWRATPALQCYLHLQGKLSCDDSGADVRLQMLRVPHTIMIPPARPMLYYAGVCDLHHVWLFCAAR